MREYTESAQMALNAINRKETSGIPTGLVHIMEHSIIERLAGAESGTYVNDPSGVYCRMLEKIGVNMVDQFLADNPLTMGNRGYEHSLDTPTAGGVTNMDGFIIDVPETCLESMESIDIPNLKKRIAYQHGIIEEILGRTVCQGHKAGCGCRFHITVVL